MEAVIGLDISTSVVGFSALTPSGALVELDHVDLKKLKSPWQKSNHVAEFLRGKQNKYLIKQVYIEQNLSKFRPGLSSAKVLMILARFNGMVSLIAYQIFGIEPVYVNFSEARNHLGIKLNRKSNIDVKDQILSSVSTMISWTWKTKTLKSGKRKGLTIFDPCCYDQADAWVVARAGIDGIVVGRRE